MGLPVEGKGDVHRPMRRNFGKDLVVESPKNQLKDVETASLEVCNEEATSGFGNPSKGPLEVESLSNLSFQNLVSFSKFVGLQVDGHEKEIASLLRKMETRKGHRVSTVKRRPPSMAHFVREL